jgi:adenylate kinase
LPQAITAADIGAPLDLTLDATIYLHVPEEVLVQRLIARGGPDDTPDVIRHRLQVFTDTTSPLIEYYRDRGILVEVSADQPPESITDEIIARLPAS